MYAEPVDPGGQGDYKRLQILAELEAKPVSSKDLVFLLDPPRFSDLPPALYVREKAKVIYPKYSKQWLSTVAHRIDCVYNEILNHGLLFSLFKFFG